MRARSVNLQLANLACLMLVACGPQFDPPSQIKSLRALAVLKDKPYALPGDDVKLDVLWHDGSPKRDICRTNEQGETVCEPRPILKAWLGGCFNPAGDVYYGCFEKLGATTEDDPYVIKPLPGTSLTISVPSDVAQREGFAPGQPKYGMAMVFFALCAGTSFAEGPPPTEEMPFPLLCLDENNQPLGSEDFVVGYTSVYAFDPAEHVSNQNPVIAEDTIQFNGASVVPECVGPACLGEVPQRLPDCADQNQGKLCIPACPDDGDESCPEYTFQPSLDPAIAERDDVSSRRVGRVISEQMWIDYYSERGEFSSSVRLLNDAITGWNPEYRAKFRAPKQTGPVRLWAAVHDNRGGTNVARLTVLVR